MDERNQPRDDSRSIKGTRIPRLPLQGQFDLTYRCNNACRHCWLRLPTDAPEEKAELSFAEIRRIADEARAMGCRQWNMSGGEPMLRPDFPEIFEYLTQRTVSYSINTNGTLITPQIARLLKRKGSKMVALYGATPDVYARVTGHADGFEKIMRGFAYLREAGAKFIVQLIPMNANWHQWNEMVALAKSLSSICRIGAPWLYLSSSGSPGRNRKIAAQRLDPRDVIELDPPDPNDHESAGKSCGLTNLDDDRLFARCIEGRSEFNVDPYGGMTWCCFVKDPALRYDLKRGTFREAWDEFIPSCAEKIRGGDEWRENCGACEKRSHCHWCAAYSYLETSRYSAPVPYLCDMAREAGEFKAKWKDNHRRYFRIAGITVCVESDQDFEPAGFKRELQAFAVEWPGDDNVTLRHHFELPDLTGKDLGTELYRKLPWVISRKKGTWFYRGISPVRSDSEPHRIGVFNADHTHGTIYSPPRDGDQIRKNGWHSLSLFQTDQIWLGPLLADRNAVLIHSAAAILNGQGLIFVGHSEAGKSTTMELLKSAYKLRDKSKIPLDVEILCDDRNIIRRWEEGWRVHGTWSHGTTEDVSPSSALLRAILFLRQAPRNEITPLTDRKKIWRNLLATLIRPMVTAEWWQKELDILEQIVEDVDFFTMEFDKTGAIVTELITLAEENGPKYRRSETSSSQA